MNAQYAAIAYSKSMRSANATYAEYANNHLAQWMQNMLHMHIQNQCGLPMQNMHSDECKNILPVHIPKPFIHQLHWTVHWRSDEVVTNSDFKNCSGLNLHLKFG